MSCWSKSHRPPLSASCWDSTRDQTHQRTLACVGRRAEPAHLSPRAQHRLAQELGRGRCNQPRRSSGPHGASRRNGLSIGADRENLGLLRRVVSRKGIQIPAALRLLRDGECAFQDQLSGRIPCADRCRSGHDACAHSSTSAGSPLDGHSEESPSAPTRPACASSTRKARSPIPPIAITACNT